MVRRFVVLFAVAASLLLSGCTARYEDMLHERDGKLREMGSEVARLRGENDDLTRRLSAAPAAPVAATARRTDDLDAIRNDVGNGAEVRYKGNRISIGVQDSVTFDSGSITLKDSAHGVLRNIAGVLKDKFGGHRLYVEGHTDSDPLVKTKDLYRSNRHLSAERADAVAAYLIKQGVPESAIVITGYGPTDPRDPRSKDKNRRVEIVVGDRL